MSYGYDAINRPTSVSAAGTNIAFGYDHANNRTSMTFPGGATGYTYDDANRLTQKSETIGNKSYTTQFGYDVNDNMTTLVYPSSLSVTYGYNGNNQVTSITGFGGSVTSVDYSMSGNTAGLPISFAISNGITSNFGYNARNLITSIGAGGALNVKYGHDSRGNTTSYTNLLDSTKNQAYGYDSLSRLTTFNGAWGSGSYGYDAIGNRTAKTVAGATTTYSYSNNRLSSASGGEPASYTYRGEGGLTGGNWQGATYSLGYDSLDNLVSYSSSSAVLAAFAYDGDGQRTIKTASGSATVYHYDLAGQVISEDDGNGNVLADYVYLNGKLIAKVTPTPSIVVSPSSESFGTVVAGYSGPARTFSVSNAGKGGLVVGTVGIAGTSPGDFTVTSDGCTGKTLAANATCSIQVSFNPTSPAAKTAYLAMTSNDPSRPSSTVALNGIGTDPQLSVVLAGAGTGLVTSSPDSTISCGATCSGTFLPGTVLTLTAAPSAGSIFTGWSGGGCSGLGKCTVAISGSTDVTATFDVATCGNAPVRIQGKGSFQSLQAAYDAAANGDVIQAVGQLFTENLMAHRNISVILDGGYKCDYKSNPDRTIMGVPLISSGRVAMKNIFIRY